MTQNLDLKKLLPQVNRNDLLDSLISNTFNRFVSEEQSVLVNGRIGKQNTSDPAIQASSLSREVNALVPALTFKTGAEDNVFTFEDMLNRLEVLDTDTNNMKKWMSEQTFNYSFPINYDKFINFSNYFWVKRSGTISSWNPDDEPEFYVIGLPKDTDLIKKPVDLATTNTDGNLTLWANNRPSETFTLTFQSNQNFVLTSDVGAVTCSTNVLASLLESSVTTVTVFDDNTQSLLKFNIIVGSNPFSAGDKFNINITYFTSNIFITLTSSNPIGKGTVSAVENLSSVLTIDGVSIQAGNRILVKNQTNQSENGIYVVTIGTKWPRAIDANSVSTLKNNSTVYVKSGNVNSGKTFKAYGVFNVNLNFALDTSSSSGLSQLNDWQEYNAWVHRDDFALLVNGDTLYLSAVQATRPIIEYDHTLELNNSTLNGYPSSPSVGIGYVQRKHSFNQIPQFNLYRYEGTHAKVTSGIFYYVEDQNYPLDLKIKRRVKTTENSDYIFGMGIKDSEGRLLHFKNNGALKSTWQAGVIDAIETLPIIFNGGTNKGSLTVDFINEYADNQGWTIKAVSPIEFSVVGSRSGTLVNAFVGTQYVCDDIKFTILNGVNPFVIGENFTFYIHAKTSPRYVKKESDGVFVNYPGGITADSADGIITGTWACPSRMFENLERETRVEINYGDLLNHVRSVIKNQNGFIGTSLGVNNVRNLDFDPGLGGTVREFSSNFPLLASMLIQKDISPLTLIDFAENQYLNALSSVDQFMINDFITYISSFASVTSSTASIEASGRIIIPTDVVKLLGYFEQLRGENVVLKDTFSDSTALVKNWPITLPMMGLKASTLPTVSFDNELGLNVVVHHDGHISPVSSRNVNLDRKLVQTVVTRSDGTSSAGIFSESRPLLPYARQLWIKPSTLQLFTFDVYSDSTTMPEVGESGAYWFNRTGSTGELYKWDTVGLVWQTTTDAISDRWVEISTSNIRNILLLAIENKLFDSVHTHQEINQDISTSDNSSYAEIELNRFASKYGYDTYAADYDVSDAFTWNYSSSGWTSKARWFDVLKEHFTTPSTLPTCRPNLEPWKLGTVAIPASETKPSNWDSLYKSNVAANEISVDVRCVAVSSIGLLYGLQTVDGVSLVQGDRILLTNQSVPQFNGIYIISTLGWNRSADIIDSQLSVKVTGGTEYSGTLWTNTNVGTVTVGSTLISFDQVRTWKQQMWTDIKAAHPSLKLSVNIRTDELLPPFVSGSIWASNEALSTTIPIKASYPYTFGQNGPIEIVWKKSLEFTYSQCRSTFRTNPLEFLNKNWGDTYIQVGSNVRVERNLLTPLPSSKFLLHGEKLSIVNSYDSENVQLRIPNVVMTTAGTISYTVSYCGDSLTIMSKRVNGTFDSYVTVNQGEVNDQGIPYEMGETLTVSFDGTSYTYSHVAATSKVFKGFGQIFTNVLRFNYIDTELSDVTQSYRGWSIKLIHRLGAMIRPDTLSINTTQGDLPSTSYSVVLKKSSNVESKWITGLRVQLVQMGGGVQNDFGFYIPPTDANDWIFRIETYNNQHPTVERYVLDESGHFETFFALNKSHAPLAWKKFKDKTSLVTTSLPKTVTGLQNVLTFIYGYIARLEEQGWTMYSDNPTTDAETGRNVDWQLELEKLIDVVYTGMTLGDGHILNPFADRLAINTPYGLLASFNERSFIDAYSMQAAYDVTGETIPVSKLSIIRSDDGTVVYSSTPIFSAHVFIDEYEHVILMNQRFSDSISSATIFDTFLGLRLNTAYLSFIRNEQSNGKPSFNGFYLSGNDVKRNITSSVDAMENYYDASQTFYEPSTAPHALALLGYTNKSYFDALNVNNTTRFNFWRGLIQAKGTNMAIDAFVNFKKFESASTDEYWAYKLATFGDARERTFPEIKIEPADTFQKFAKFQFYSSDDSSYNELPLFTQIENSDDTRWYSIDDLGNGMKFDAEKISETLTVTSNGYYNLSNIYHNSHGVVPTVTGGATVINANLIYAPIAGTYTISGFTWNNPVKHSPIKLFDYSDNALIEEISLWHPAIGIHATAPLELVNMISDTDPAFYNYSTQTTNNTSYRTLKPWGKREVGRVFWDTSNLGYVPYYDAVIFPNIDARHARWGSLAEWASIDLYEWTESSVHPSGYDALAESEEGDSQIDVSIRASGRVALKKYYSRNRTLKIRPIAWSKSEEGFAAAHPSFGSSSDTTIWISGNTLVADIGRVSDLNIVSGRNFGGWDTINSKPVGEVVIGTDLSYFLGSSSSISVPELNSNISVASLTGGLFGTRIGPISLTRKSLTENVIRVIDNLGFYEDVDVADWVSDNLQSDNILTVKFKTFGIQIQYVRTVTGTITAASIITAITDTTNDLFIREAVVFTKLIDLSETRYINDSTDPNYSSSEYEWRTWEVPTQTMLDADLIYPNNTWLPYLGDVSEVNASAAVVAEMKKSANTLTLKNGTEITRYSSSWSNWAALSQQKYDKISDGVNLVSFVVPSDVDINRVSVYVNGIQINPSEYEIVILDQGTYVRMINKKSEGFNVTMIYRAYAPSDSDLAFDPSITDDFSIQTQYKLDYEYTQLEVRNSDGNVTGTKYYFWVQDKSISQSNKSMSLLEAKNLLKSGPSTYMIYARLINSTASYDSFAVSGLNRFVTKNDSYKLRMMRNFTLLDDPEELSLKNVHTEWVLIRKQQSSKIPSQLWDTLTDAVAGEDIGGNKLPSQTRIDYDLRNGTRSRYGFGNGRIFADSELLKVSITNTILNTKLTLNLVNKIVPDYISALNFDDSDKWFKDAATARLTMNLIWNKGRASQINEIFFDTLEDALSKNYEFSDIFKTSLITVNSVTKVTDNSTQEQMDEFY